MNTQIYDEAAQWLVELETDETDARMRGRFSAWLDASPEHVRAFLETTALWEDGLALDERRVIDVDALMAAVKTERTLVPLDVISSGHPDAGAPGGRWSTAPQRGWRFAFAASMALLMIGVVATGYWMIDARGVYATEVREQRTLVLRDGTIVELNADTRIRERFTDTERAVDLLKGQALFRVAKHAARPFVVRNDSMSVRAIGTQFDVHRRATGTTVTVLEGRVAVLPLAGHEGAPSIELSKERPTQSGHSREAESPTLTQSVAQSRREILLGAGEQLTVHEGVGATAPAPADMRMAAAWTQRRIALEFANLRDAAEEFNRFNTRKVVVEPEGIEDFKVSGTFDALDPDSLERFVRFLRDQPGLSVLEHDHRILVKRNR